MKFTRERVYSVRSSDYIEVNLCVYSDEQEKAVRLKRAKRSKATEPKVKKLNDEYSRQYARLLLNGNFGPGDYQIWLSYEEEPPDRKIAKRYFDNFKDRLRRLYRKNGIEFKWLGVTEHGAVSGRIHHHLVIPGGVDRNMIEELWGKGIANCKRIQKNQSGKWLNDLAKYLLKSKANAEKSERVWSHSTNLVKPDVRVCDNDRINRKRLKQLVEAARNDEVKQAAENIYKGYQFIEARVEENAVTGLPHAHIIMARRE